jgi:anaerobic selenocysteine-containing dehydrogenase
MPYVETVCSRDCYDTCFMKVLVGRNGEAIHTQGDKISPINQGFLCPRGTADVKRTYSKQRILYPHKRMGEKPDGAFERISWNHAIDIFADRIADALNRFGPNSILNLFYSGNMGLLTSFLPQRLFYALGSCQTDEAICSKAGHDAISLHYGSSCGIDPEDLPKMKLTVYWGFNAAVSAPHLYSLSSKTRSKNGFIVAIDPRQSETAKTADLWIQPKPGSDLPLAYGVMKQLITGNLVDLDFVKRYTTGFKELRNETAKWTSEAIEKITGLDWGTIVKLADLYASKKPSVTMIGIGMQKSLGGAESTRAISLIPALIGSPRGFFYTNGRCWDIDNSYLTGESLTRKKIKVVSQVKLGDHLNRGEFKFLYVYNMNPAMTLPNAQAVADGLKRKDLFVVVNDTHWTETAKKYADLVLPAPTFLEKEDIVPSYSHRYIRKSRKVIEPLGESKDELWLTSQLTKRLNLDEVWLREDPWAAIEKAMANAFEEGSPTELKEGKILKLKMRPSTDYRTPSKRLEFYSSEAEGHGVASLPKHVPPPEVNGFILLASAVSKYTHTQFQDVYGPLPSSVTISPEDARTHAISSKDSVELFNELGRIRLRAEVSNSVPRGVLWAQRECCDLDGKPMNILVLDATQQIGQGSTYNTTIVGIRKR